MNTLWESIASKFSDKKRGRSSEEGVVSVPDEDLGYVFILTYGRSGSTLLQGILGSTPGYLIRGENRGILYNLYKFHSTAVDRKMELTKDFARLNLTESLPETHAWYGLDGYPEDVALGDIRRLMMDTILRPNPGTRVAGFKEIRWAQKDLERYLEFVRAVFPGARFIVNTRCHEDVSKSHWWAKDPDALTKIKQREDKLLDAAAQLGDHAYRVHYDDYVADPGVLRGLFEWLGEEFDEVRVRRTMGERHSV